MRSRIIFRVLIALTLAIMFFARWSGGRMGAKPFLPFYYWFLASVFVFATFGLRVRLARFREPHNRRAYLTDVVLAAAWVPYWLANIR